MALIPVYASIEDYMAQAVNTGTVPPNAPYPAQLLIDRAWNLSGIVAREFETVRGEEGSDGLFLLNELLYMKAFDLKLIPYFARVEFNLVQGQERYYIPNLYQVETFTFNIGDVRFPTYNASRSHYFGDGRVDDIQSLPFEWHLERVQGGSYLYVYFVPEQQFLAKVTAKFALTNVELQTNLALYYDGFYISYLRYALANAMSLEYDISFAPDKLLYMRQMEQKLLYVSYPDISAKKISFINNNQPFNWAKVNISPAWNVS